MTHTRNHAADPETTRTQTYDTLSFADNLAVHTSG